MPFDKNFIGVYPSPEQIAYAESKGTEFIFTPIGKEAFVFFDPVTRLPAT